MEYRSDAAGTTRPRILLLVGLLGVGGAERHMVTLSNQLGERFDITLVYVKDQADLAGHIDRSKVAEVVCLHAKSGIDRAALRRLAALVDERKPGVVLCANTYPLFYAHAARLMARHKPRVIEVFHTTILQTWKQRLLMVGFRPLFWVSDRLVYVSSAQRDYWRRRMLWGRQEQVIHNGVDVEHFEPSRFAELGAQRRAELGFRPDDLIVGICAVMRPEKVHGDLLEALASEGGSRWKALLIGDGPCRPQIERDIDRLGLRDRIRITGYTSDVRPYLAACDLIALVSVTETFSIAVLEAMSMAKPVVLSDVGGSREQVTDGVDGWLFPPRDVQALARCLRSIGSSRPKIEESGRRARDKVVRQFSLPVMITKYEQLLQQTLS